MRRFLMVVPVFLALGCLGGCGDNDAATTTAAPATAAAPTTTTTAPTTTTTTAVPTTTTTTPSGGVTLVIEMEDTPDWYEMDDAVGSGEGTFAATGPAVEDGVMCPSGTVVWTLQSATSTGPGTLAFSEESTVTATCDDGESGFTLWEEVEAKYGPRGTSEGFWTMGEGSGTLAGWVGEGSEEGTWLPKGPSGNHWNWERTYLGVLSAEG